MRTTIDLPEGLLAEAKTHALRAGVSLSAWVTEAVRRATMASPSSTAPFDLPVCGSPGGPTLSWEQIKALIAEEDDRPYREMVRAAEPKPAYKT